MLGQHSEAVALPESPADRVEPHGAAGHTTHQTQHMDGRGSIVMLVPVGAGEDPLLVDEDNLPDPELLSELPRSGNGSAGQGRALS